MPPTSGLRIQGELGRDRVGPIRRLVRAATVATLTALLVAAPVPVLAHQLGGTFRSPLPLAFYLLGAAIAVAASFGLAFRRDVLVPKPSLGRMRTAPAWLRVALQAVGILAWLWVLVQTLVLGGSSEADVSSLFLWVYGWVGLALVSGLLGPVWSWLDPFSTLHRALTRLGRLGGRTDRSSELWPEGLGRWPAVVGYVFFVWLELVATGGAGGPNLGAALLVYSLVTLAGMVWLGRSGWRRRGEVFSVWFGLLGRLAPWRSLGDPARGRVTRQPFASGIVHARWATDEVVLVAVATAAVMFDGLSQTVPFFQLFGLPSLGTSTLLLFAFLALVAGAVLGVSRIAGLAAVGAGLLPIALGYITAHYLTFLIGDGQRIFIALSDPFQQGWDLLGTAFFRPSIDWLPGSVLWAVQLGAVVSGHVVGAWAGHAAALAHAGPDADRRSLVRRQIPLAMLMVVLTVVTLWSLGQALVEPTP